MDMSKEGRSKEEAMSDQHVEDGSTSAYARAKKRVQDVKGFYTHLGIYFVVNLGLFAINAVTAWGSWWFYWPALGWGIGVACHAVALIVDTHFGEDWEERRIQRVMQRDASRLAH
jgi:hypothetical protein